MSRFSLRSPNSPFAPVITGCVYFAAASFTVSISRFEGGLAFIWIANAFLMAELLTTRMSYWPRAVFACALASAVATALFGIGPAAAVSMAFINVSESLIVAAICRYFLKDDIVLSIPAEAGAFDRTLDFLSTVTSGLRGAESESTF